MPHTGVACCHKIKYSLYALFVNVKLHKILLCIYKLICFSDTYTAFHLSLPFRSILRNTRQIWSQRPNWYTFLHIWFTHMHKIYNSKETIQLKDAYHFWHHMILHSFYIWVPLTYLSCDILVRGRQTLSKYMLDVINILVPVFCLQMNAKKSIFGSFSQLSISIRI